MITMDAQTFLNNRLQMIANSIVKQIHIDFLTVHIKEISRQIQLYIGLNCLNI